MWKSQQTILQESQHQYHLLRDGDRLTFGDFLRALREDAGFRKFYNTLLADSPFEGIYWEHPPLAESMLEQPYEMVLIEAPYFSRVAPQPDAYREHFVDGELVADFGNLSGDARLVVPTPQGDAGIYTHLASFVRRAPAAQRDAFWQRVEECLAEEIEEGKRWLSTAGGGVSWLHVRIDQRPKYYKYLDYRR